MPKKNIEIKYQIVNELKSDGVFVKFNYPGIDGVMKPWDYKLSKRHR